MSERPSGQPAPDRAPTVEALTDEKDPVVRSYLENLRRQVADIAAKYGANAREVWNSDVQARMRVDDMDRVNGLFRRIRAVANRSLSRVERTEMEREFEEKESVAREMLRRAEAIHDPDAGQPIEFVEYALREKLFAEAARIVTQYRVDAPKLLSEAYSAIGRSIVDSNPTAARWWVDAARRSALGYFQQTDEVQPCLDAYGAALETYSDAEVANEQGRMLGEPAILLPVLVERLAIELSRRGIPEDRERMEQIRSAASAAVRVRPTEFGMQIINSLAIARLHHQNGMPAADELRNAVGLAKVQPIWWKKHIRDIVRVAGEIGEFSFAQELLSEDWWKDPSENMHLPFFLLTGIIEGKNFEKAFENLRADEKAGEPSSQNAVAVDDLIDALLDDNQLSRAEQAFHEFVEPHHPGEMGDIPGYQAALARRGVNVFDDVEKRVAAAEDDGIRASLLASAALATIGFLESMKKRLGV